MYNKELISNKDWFSEQLDLGKTRKEIAEEIGCSLDMVTYYAKKHGLKNVKKRLYIDKEWLENELKTKSRSQIAEENNIGRHLITKAVMEHGLEEIKGWKRVLPPVPQVKFPQLQNKEWLENELKTKSKLQIAEEIGATYSAVTYMANKHGIRVGRSGNRRVSATRSSTLKKTLVENPHFRKRGEDSPRWKGGKSVGRYIRTRVLGHPNADARGYVMEHRLVMEKKLGRHLKVSEIVHHLDGNRHNNDISNLKLTTRKEHFSDHFDAVKEVKASKEEVEKLR